ncbi:beta-ketoacyl synthase N-terminal-like domain-containing protein [Streptomyces sp. NPDC015492]|uniref:type I polyketide synthase n=1 Tax=Streptomyces sp. NPDC015492 TaxID=3364958 RepID=UPI0036FB28B4
MTDQAVAIVGMAGKFPGADTVDDFWANLKDGVSSIRSFSRSEVLAAGTSESVAADPSFVASGGDLDGAELFDAAFFRMTPREAELTDPQHRLFLTCAYQALLDAGNPPGASGRQVGVFASGSYNTYLLANILRNKEFSEAALSHPVIIGNDKDFLASRVSYKLNLTGPSITVQTACSSSLASVHLACASLQRAETDVAIAGGVSITIPQKSGYVYQEGGVFSSDGACRPFDKKADGMVKGNGCGVVVLKRLSDAVKDRDRIYAVIRGVATSNDGSTKIGFAAPGPDGQRRAIKSALVASGIPSSRIGYVEAHGTGTALGDPVELRALAKAYKEAGGPQLNCELGSVKANVGHLDAAAGVVGLIKTALILYHQIVPQQINFDEPNPHLALDKTPFVISTKTRPTDLPLTAAAVSSFGLGGTNTHCVLEAFSADQREKRREVPYAYPFVFSAQSPAALTEAARRLLGYVALHQPDLVDLSYTLLTGRDSLEHRHAFLACNLKEVEAALAEFLSEGQSNIGSSSHSLRASIADLSGEFDFSSARKISLPAHPLFEEPFWIEPDKKLGPSSHASADGEIRRAGGDADGGEIVDRVIGIFERHLGISHISPDQSYYRLGGDSLLAVQIVSELRDSLQTDIRLDEFLSLLTARAIANRIARQGDHGGSRDQTEIQWIRKGGGNPLFLMPPGGGTTFCYAQLASGDSIPHAPPIAALSFPQHLAGNVRSVRDLAAHYIQQIRKMQPQGPYRLGGYSFGGVVAFEMAVQMQRKGEKVESLLLFDSFTPDAHVGAPNTEPDIAAMLPDLLQDIGLSMNIDLARGREISTVEDVVLCMKRPGWSDSTVQEYRRLVEIWRHNLEALSGYYPDSQFIGDVNLIRAEEGPTPAIARSLREGSDSPETWGNHITGRLTIFNAPGNHFTMFGARDNIAALRTICNSIFGRSSV